MINRFEKISNIENETYNEAESFRKKTTNGIFKKESNVETEFPEATINKWGEGAESFHKFLQQIDNPKYNQNTIGPLQGMFLGEKPACFIESLCLKYEDELEPFGFKTIGDYTYNPELVAETMQKYKTEFDKHQLKTPEQTMRTLAQSKKDEFHLIRGLILGVPLESAKNWEYDNSLQINDIAKKLYDLLKKKPEEQMYLELAYYTEQLKGNHDLIPFFKSRLKEYQTELELSNDEITNLLHELRYQINSKGVNIYGIAWADYDHSKESEKKQKRLKGAFEKSGILK